MTVGSNLTLRDKTLSIEAIFPYARIKNLSSTSVVCRLVKDVRTRWINRDPQLLKLVDDIRAIERQLPQDLRQRESTTSDKKPEEESAS